MNALKPTSPLTAPNLRPSPSLLARQAADPLAARAMAGPAIGRDQLSLSAAGDVIACHDLNGDGYLSGTEILPDLRPYALPAADGRQVVTTDGLVAKTKAPQGAQPAQPAAPAAPAKPVAPAQPIQQPADGADFAARVLALTNLERTKRGLAPFTPQDGLDAVATRRSQDMVQRGYFSHTDPDGRSPFYHIQKAGIPHRLAAENIAYGQRTPEEVVRTWMYSAGHRANILNPGLSHLGIGSVRAANGQVYWTQLFAG